MKKEYSNEHPLLIALDMTMTELASVRGLSRQYCTRNIDKFAKDEHGLKNLHTMLQSINTASSNQSARNLVEYCEKNGIRLLEESPKETIIRFIKNELRRVSFSQDTSKQIKQTKEYLRYLEMISKT